MIKKILITTLIALPQITFAKTIKCAVDKNDAQFVDVPVFATSLPTPEPDETVRFEGKKFAVVWFAGNEFEKQTRLTMKFDGHASTVRNFSLNGHMSSAIDYQGIRFQCWVE